MAPRAAAHAAAPAGGDGEEFRTTALNVNAAEPSPFCDNTISTSKYTAWSFVPRSLFEQ